MPIPNATTATSGSGLYIGAFTSSKPEPGNLYREPFNWRWPAPTQLVLSWVVLGRGDLIPTTDLMPGILQLSSAADVGGRFRLVQDTLNNRGIRDTGTLATSSSTCPEEQTHIHVCDHPGSTERGILDKLHRDNFKTISSADLSALPKPSAAMSYRASPNKRS
ncbi:hypothetical protein ACN42_g1484 [Penicillium freii]|uniref:Uncharacterized protein n=1 Tax=Penicillium freii TaxID=48697 RepID=A0A101MRV9_PENFR|nr:hypothetical protein ACN42_g1484 [Penicillium freii]